VRVLFSANHEIVLLTRFKLDIFARNIPGGSHAAMFGMIIKLATKPEDTMNAQTTVSISIRAGCAHGHAMRVQKSSALHGFQIYDNSHGRTEGRTSKENHCQNTGLHIKEEANLNLICIG
jgi:hypothetical protein